MARSHPPVMTAKVMYERWASSWRMVCVAGCRSSGVGVAHLGMEVALRGVASAHLLYHHRDAFLLRERLRHRDRGLAGWKRRELHRDAASDRARSGDPVQTRPAADLRLMRVGFKLQENACRVGAALAGHLVEFQQRYPVIGDVRGRGMILAVECVKDRATREPDTETTACVFERTREEGLVANKSGPHRSLLRMMPLFARRWMTCRSWRNAWIAASPPFRVKSRPGRGSPDASVRVRHIERLEPGDPRQHPHTEAREFGVASALTRASLRGDSRHVWFSSTELQPGNPGPGRTVVHTVVRIELI